MKKLFLKLLIAGLMCSTLWISSCKKGSDNFFDNSPPTELPPATNEGKNTFGCIIDGKIMALPYPPSTLSCYYYYENGDNLRGTFSVRALEGATFSSNSRRIDFVLDKALFDTGFYKISSPKVRLEYLKKTEGNYIRYECKDSMYGWLHITTIDTGKRVIAGAFEYDVINEKDPSDTVKIRDGRFDAKFYD